MSGSYKYCVVPKCTSTTVATPDKLFIHVPKDVKQRKAWLTAMRRADPLSNKTTAFVCEEHFNLEQDMENYIRFQIMKEGPIRLHPGVIPHKFKCQQSQTTAHIKAPRQSSLKRKHQAMVQDLLSQPQPCTSSTPDFDEELPESDFIDEVQVGEDPILSSDEDYATIMEVKEVVATAKKSTDTHHLRTTKQCKKLLQNMKTERKNYFDTGNMGDLHLSTSLQPTNSDRVDRVETISVKTDPEDMIDIHDDVKERIERMYGMNKEELTKIPGTSESTNNNFAPTADFSYQGSYDGSHCGNSVLQDSTNNMDASYDNTYDTIYDDSVAPPPIKRKRPTSSSDNLNENYQAFSELVVAKLKSLPANRAALLQLKIQELLSREIVNLEMDEGDNETEEEVCGEQEGEEEEEMSLETGSKPNEIETPPSRSEECPNETTQVEHKTTTTTTSVTTTIAKKRKVAPAQVHDSAENKENAQVFLDDSYRAFSKCIVSQLRYLPTPVAVKTQNKIQRVLSDEISEFYNKTASASQEPEETSPSIRVKEEPLDYNDS